MSLNNSIKFNMHNKFKFPKLSFSRGKLPYFAEQQGSSLVIALFVIVILTLLGGVLMKVISTSSESFSQEIFGTRAYMAANSAMQAELQKLFPLNTPASGYCDTDINVQYDLQTSAATDIAGLYDCTAETNCENYYTDSDGIKYYRLTSTGKCGSADMAEESNAIIKSSRTIQVEARSL